MGRNISNLRYSNDTTLIAESEGLKSLLMKLKEESEKADLKLNIQKTKIVVSGPISSWQIDGEMTISLHSKITADGDCSHEIKRCLLLGRKSMTNLDSVLKHRAITFLTKVRISLVQLISVAQSCLTLCDPTNHSTPGLPVHHQLPESTQTHVH